MKIFQYCAHRSAKHFWHLCDKSKQLQLKQIYWRRNSTEAGRYWSLSIDIFSNLSIDKNICIHFEIHKCSRINLFKMDFKQDISCLSNI